MHWEFLVTAQYSVKCAHKVVKIERILFLSGQKLQRDVTKTETREDKREKETRTFKSHYCNLCVKKVLNIPGCVLYFRLSKVATFSFDDSVALMAFSHKIHQVVTWNGFQFTGVP